METADLKTCTAAHWAVVGTQHPAQLTQQVVGQATLQQ